MPQSQESEPSDCKFFSDPCPAVHTSEASVSFVPTDIFNIVSSADSPLEPPDIPIIPFGSFCDGSENISAVVASANMAERKRALLPPSYQVQQTQNGGNHIKVKEITNPVYEEQEASQHRKKLTLPLPDYESLFPQKRHGVQGQTQWDHIIAEVNQKHRDTPSQFSGKEMSVDGPEQHSTISSPQQTHTALRHYQTRPQETLKKPPSVLSREFSGRSRIEAAEVSRSSVPVPEQMGQMNAFDAQVSGDHRNTQLTGDKDPPTAKPRQRINGSQLHEQDAVATPVASFASSRTSNTSVSGTDKNGQWKENFAIFDPFPSTDILLKDPWTQLTNNQQDPFTSGGPKEQKMEDSGMTVQELNDVFGQSAHADPFADFNGVQLNRHEKGSQNQNLTPANQSNQTLKSTEALAPMSTSDHIGWARSRTNKSPPQKHQADERTLNAVGGGEDPFGTEPVSVIPPRTFSDSLQVVLEEPAEYQGESVSGGKMPLRAWVSPSEGQPVNAQNSSGSGQVLFQRR